MTDDTARLASELVDELLHNYPRGRVTFAVDALPGDDTTVIVDALAAQLATRGVAVQRVTVSDAAAADAFRALVLTTFRTDPELARDAVLLVEGTGLHAPGIVDVWSMSIWLSSAQEPDPIDPEARRYLFDDDPPRRADVIIDVTDPAHPVRRFVDWCVVPRRRRR